jgi:CheY-like chemotaxis protein
MRTRDNTRDMPIIMLTARCEENEHVRGLSVGADDYVVNPPLPRSGRLCSPAASASEVDETDGLDQEKTLSTEAGLEINRKQ